MSRFRKFGVGGPVPPPTVGRQVGGVSPGADEPAAEDAADPGLDEVDAVPDDVFHDASQAEAEPDPEAGPEPEPPAGGDQGDAPGDDVTERARERFAASAAHEDDDAILDAEIVDESDAPDLGADDLFGPPPSAEGPPLLATVSGLQSTVAELQEGVAGQLARLVERVEMLETAQRRGVAELAELLDTRAAGLRERPSWADELRPDVRGSDMAALRAELATLAGRRDDADAATRQELAEIRAATAALGGLRDDLTALASRRDQADQSAANELAAIRSALTSAASSGDDTAEQLAGLRAAVEAAGGGEGGGGGGDQERTAAELSAMGDALAIAITNLAALADDVSSVHTVSLDTQTAVAAALAGVREQLGEIAGRPDPSAALSAISVELTTLTNRPDPSAAITELRELLSAISHRRQQTDTSTAQELAAIRAALVAEGAASTALAEQLSEVRRAVTAAEAELGRRHPDDPIAIAIGALREEVAQLAEELRGALDNDEQAVEDDDAVPEILDRLDDIRGALRLIAG